MADETEPGPELQKTPHEAAGGASLAGDGSLLEVTAKLAGEPGTDHPSCVHPTLGSIARAVDEHSSEAAREALRPLAPELIGTALPGFDTSARLVAMCVSTALASPGNEHITADENRRLSAARQTALHLLRGRGAGYALAVDFPDGEPQLRGVARWWVPALGVVGLSERFYRCFVATGHVAQAVAVTARVSGTARDLRLRQLLRMCIAATPRD